MAERLPQPEVAALVRGAGAGAPPRRAAGRTRSPRQARDARAALRRRVQEDAARAGPKIQLVVALLLVPSVLLLVAAALVAALLGSGGVSGDLSRPTTPHRGAGFVAVRALPLQSGAQRGVPQRAARSGGRRSPRPPTGPIASS